MKRIPSVMRTGIHVNGLERVVPKGDVGGGSWNWNWWWWGLEVVESARRMVRRVGTRVAVTIEELVYGRVGRGVNKDAQFTSFEWFEYIRDVPSSETRVASAKTTGKSILYPKNQIPYVVFSNRIGRRTREHRFHPRLQNDGGALPRCPRSEGGVPPSPCIRRPMRT